MSAGWRGNAGRRRGASAQAVARTGTIARALSTRVALAIVLAVSAIACSAPRAPDDPLGERIAVHLLDVAGRDFTPTVVRDAKAHVVIFMGLECPIANGYAPEIDALTREYAPRGVRVFLVWVDRDATAETVSAHVKDFSLSAPSLLDTGRALVHALGAKVTPECVVLDARGVAYRGRIDDQYVALGKKRSVVTSKDLRDALELVLTGKRTIASHTKPIGCLIE